MMKYAISIPVLMASLYSRVAETGQKIFVNKITALRGELWKI